MKYNKSVFKALAMITQLGISIMTPIFLCVVVGNVIENKLGISITAVLIVLGILAGGRNAYILAQQVVKNEDEKFDKKSDKK